MRKWVQKHRKAVIFAAVVASLWFCNWLFFGFSFDFFAKQRLLSAQVAWESQNIRDYRMIIEVAGGFMVRTQYLVTVRDNHVTDAAQRLAIDLRDPDYDPMGTPFSSIPIENASRFTIDTLFSYADSELANDTFVHVNDACNRYDADFDPKMSFINLYSNWCDGSLLGCAMGECAYTYRVIELEPLFVDTE